MLFKLTKYKGNYQVSVYQQPLSYYLIFKNGDGIITPLNKASYTRPITNSGVAKEITRKLIIKEIKEIKMDNVWFIPLQFSVTIPIYALSGLEINRDLFCVI